MKTQTTVKPTQEEKAAYMATYWGQKVWIVALNGTGFIQKVCASYFTKYSLKYRCLLLTPLSDITDDDAIEISKFHMDLDKVTGKFIFIGREGAIRYVKNNIYFLVDFTKTADFLRSRGYALPWRGYTVEQLIEFGWLKLRQKGGE